MLFRCRVSVSESRMTADTRPGRSAPPHAPNRRRLTGAGHVNGLPRTQSTGAAAGSRRRCRQVTSVAAFS
jgi:hypothetical protein